MNRGDPDRRARLERRVLAAVAAAGGPQSIADLVLALQDPNDTMLRSVVRALVADGRLVAAKVRRVHSGGPDRRFPKPPYETTVYAPPAAQAVPR